MLALLSLKDTKKANSSLFVLLINSQQEVFSVLWIPLHLLGVTLSRRALLREGVGGAIVCDHQSLCAGQCRRWAHRDLHRDRCHAGGAGRRGQSGCLRIHCETAPAALPHGPSGGISLKLLSQLSCSTLTLYQGFSTIYHKCIVLSSWSCSSKK